MNDAAKIRDGMRKRGGHWGSLTLIPKFGDYGYTAR